MDRSQHTFSSLDELRQIQFDARRSNSLENLRDYFQRVQSLRRNHVDDFDLQLLIAEVQEEIIERARVLNEQKGERSPGYFEENTPAHLVRRAAPNRSAREDAIGPLPVRQMDRRERTILLRRVLQHRLNQFAN